MAYIFSLRNYNSLLNTNHFNARILTHSHTHTINSHTIQQHTQHRYFLLCCLSAILHNFTGHFSMTLDFFIKTKNDEY